MGRYITAGDSRLPIVLDALSDELDHINDERVHSLLNDACGLAAEGFEWIVADETGNHLAAFAKHDHAEMFAGLSMTLHEHEAREEEMSQDGENRGWDSAYGVEAERLEGWLEVLDEKLELLKDPGLLATLKAMHDRLEFCRPYRDKLEAVDG